VHAVLVRRNGLDRQSKKKGAAFLPYMHVLFRASSRGLRVCGLWTVENRIEDGDDDGEDEDKIWEERDQV
jgi:hypothetical protein